MVVSASMIALTCAASGPGRNSTSRPAEAGGTFRAPGPSATESPDSPPARAPVPMTRSKSLNRSDRNAGASASVGPLFFGAAGSPHTCTASVVDSPAGDLIVTAAHCLSGSGAGVSFVPGYRNGRAPYGTWTVSRAYAAPAWQARNDPHADYAFLAVDPLPGNPKGAASVESVVGGAVLGSTPPDGRPVTLTGYLEGIDDRALVCAASTYLAGEYPAVDCAGFADGTSGAPWIAPAQPGAGSERIAGVTGGPHQGGCSDDTSYTALFDASTVSVYQRASSDQPPDVLPTAGSSGC